MGATQRHQRPPLISQHETRGLLHSPLLSPSGVCPPVLSALAPTTSTPSAFLQPLRHLPSSDLYHSYLLIEGPPAGPPIQSVLSCSQSSLSKTCIAAHTSPLTKASSFLPTVFKVKSKLPAYPDPACLSSSCVPLHTPCACTCARTHTLELCRLVPLGLCTHLSHFLEQPLTIFYLITYFFWLITPWPSRFSWEASLDPSPGAPLVPPPRCPVLASLTALYGDHLYTSLHAPLSRSAGTAGDPAVQQSGSLMSVCWVSEWF